MSLPVLLLFNAMDLKIAYKSKKIMERVRILTETNSLLFFFAQILKHFHMHDHPSLEVLTVVIFAYMPYGLSEGLKLSGNSYFLVED